MTCLCMSCREKELRNERRDTGRQGQIETRSLYRRKSTMLKDDGLRRLRSELRQEDNPSSD